VPALRPNNPTGSILDAVLKCPGLWVLPHCKEQDKDVQVRGIVIHATIELAAKRGVAEAVTIMSLQYPEHAATIEDIPWDELEQELAMEHEVALAYSPSRDEGRLLGTSGRDYDSVKDDEYALTVDVLKVEESRVIVKDYKSGYALLGPAQHAAQLLLGALAACRAYGKRKAYIEYIYVRNPFFRDGVEVDVFELEVFRGKLLRLDEKLSQARRRIELGQMPDVTSGKHCRYCPATNSCPSQKSLAIELSTGASAPSLNTSLTRGQMADAWEKIDVAQSLLNKMRAAIIGEAAREPIQLKNGKMLGQVQKRGQESLCGDVTYEVIKELYGERVASDSVKFTTTKKDIKAALKSNGIEKHTVAQKEAIEIIRERGGSKRSKPKSEVKEYEPKT